MLKKSTVLRICKNVLADQFLFVYLAQRSDLHLLKKYR